MKRFKCEIFVAGGVWKWWLSVSGNKSQNVCSEWDIATAAWRVEISLNIHIALQLLLSVLVPVNSRLSPLITPLPDRPLRNLFISFLHELYLIKTTDFSSGPSSSQRNSRAHDLPISCFSGTEQLKITLNYIGVWSRGLRMSKRTTFFCYPNRKLSSCDVALFPSVGCPLLWWLVMLLSRRWVLSSPLILKLWHCWCDLNT